MKQYLNHYIMSLFMNVDFIDTQERNEDQVNTAENKLTTKTSQTEQNIELDITSEQFNPLRALYAKDYKVSTKKPKVIYQNIAAFESALKKFGIFKLNKNNEVTPQEKCKPCTSDAKLKNLPLSGADEETERRFLPHQYPIHASTKLKQRHKRNIFMQISSIEGPQSRLMYCVQKQLRIRVSLRTNQGVHGFVEGRLKIFDKHWNMVLTEVFESWKRRKYKFGENKICGSSINCDSKLQSLGIELPKTMMKSLNRKNVEIQRNISQLFVRGEQVVLVTLLNTKRENLQLKTEP